MSLRPSEQAEHRRSSFKASVSAADGRRRRVSFMDGLRKEVRSGALRTPEEALRGPRGGAARAPGGPREDAGESAAVGGGVALG